MKSWKKNYLNNSDEITFIFRSTILAIHDGNLHTQKSTILIKNDIKCIKKQYF